MVQRGWGWEPWVFGCPTLGGSLHLGGSPQPLTPGFPTLGVTAPQTPHTSPQEGSPQPPTITSPTPGGPCTPRPSDPPSGGPCAPAPSALGGPRTPRPHPWGVPVWQHPPLWWSPSPQTPGSPPGGPCTLKFPTPENSRTSRPPDPPPPASSGPAGAPGGAELLRARPWGRIGAGGLARDRPARSHSPRVPGDTGDTGGSGSTGEAAEEPPRAAAAAMGRAAGRKDRNGDYGTGHHPRPPGAPPKPRVRAPHSQAAPEAGIAQILGTLSVLGTPRLGAPRV